MFQYALGRVLSIRNHTDLKLDISFFSLNLKNVTKRSFDLGVFNISGTVAQISDIPFLFRLYNNKILVRPITLLRKIVKSKGTEKSFAFSPSIFTAGENLYLEGYWQSPKYFSGFEDIIRKDFTLKNIPAQNIQDLAKEISDTNALCMHVRRGDYVGNKSHEGVNNEYYNKGIAAILEKTQIEKIYVFSEDIAWCENNLKFTFPTMYVADTYAGEKGEGHMFLMSNCKSFIIANSSFSWWAAWLSSHTHKVIVCPKQWFPDATINTSDLIPSDWIRI